MREPCLYDSYGASVKWSFSLGRIAGIDVRVHATFFLLVAWFAWSEFASKGTLAAALSSVVLISMLFSVVVLHELGHALTVRHYGVATRDITLLPIGGVARLEGRRHRPVPTLESSDGLHRVFW